MWQLKNQGLIDYNTVMVNMQNNHGNSSIIKFGSWDKDTMVQDGIETLHIFPCTSNGSWNLESIYQSYNEKAFVGVGAKTMVISPHLPYLYMPKPEWTHVAF